MAEQIRAIVFDAGGVLHQPNTAVTEDLAQELGLTEEELAQIWATDIEDLGKGEITEADFWSRLRSEYGVRNVSTEENLLGRAFAKNYSAQPGINWLIERIWYWGPEPKLGLLSNTIEPHARVMRENTNDFRRFNAVGLSYEIGMRKPEAGAFEFILDKLGVEPEEAIMVDDDPINVEAAANLGMVAIHYVDARQLDIDLSSHVKYSI